MRVFLSLYFVFSLPTRAIQCLYIINNTCMTESISLGWILLFPIVPIHDTRFFSLLSRLCLPIKRAEFRETLFFSSLSLSLSHSLSLTLLLTIVQWTQNTCDSINGDHSSFLLIFIYLFIRHLFRQYTTTHTVLVLQVLCWRQQLIIFEKNPKSFFLMPIVRIRNILNSRGSLS